MRHDPQRFVGKIVYVPHFNRDTVEFASRERDESKPGIKTLLPFLKNITEESDLENFSGSHTGLRCLLSVSQGNVKFIAIRRRSKPVRFKGAISCFSEDFLYCLVLCLYVYFYFRRVKEICSSYLDLLK